MSKTLTVLPPDGKSGASNSLLNRDAPLAIDANFAQRIEADLVASERHARVAAFVALRVGVQLVAVRDLGRHGDLEKFLREHFSHRSDRTMRNYIRIADTFLREAGFKSKQTFKLEDHKAIAPIFEEQLDLFLSPEKEKLAGAQKKLVKWMEGRGLNEILRDITARAHSHPPVNHGNAGARNHKLPVTKKRDDALAALAALEAGHKSGDWKFLEDDELARLENALTAFEADVSAQITKRKGVRP